jgi:hypothetical protein
MLQLNKFCIYLLEYILQTGILLHWEPVLDKSHLVSYAYLKDKLRRVQYFSFMMFNAIFNNISVLSWQSVLLVEITGVPGENHRLPASHWQTLSHNVVSSTPRLSGIQTHNVSGDRHRSLHRYTVVISPTTIKNWSRQPRRVH